jgi:hypothetical protein
MQCVPVPVTRGSQLADRRVPSAVCTCFRNVVSACLFDKLDGSNTSCYLEVLSDPTICDNLKHTRFL